MSQSYTCYSEKESVVRVIEARTSRIAAEKFANIVDDETDWALDDEPLRVVVTAENGSNRVYHVSFDNRWYNAIPVVKADEPEDLTNEAVRIVSANEMLERLQKVERELAQCMEMLLSALESIEAKFNRLAH